MSALYSEPAAAFAILTMLDTLGEFFQVSDKEQFSKADILVVFAMFRDHSGLLEPAHVIAYQEQIAEMERLFAS